MNTDLIKNIVRFTLIVLIALFPLYCLVGQFIGRVNIEHLPERELPLNASHIINANARIIERELQSGWAPSAKFSPIRVRADVDAFQRGLLEVVTRALQDMNNRLFRVGSENNADVNLKNALNDINRPADIWSIFAANSTVSRLEKAIQRLDAYNDHLIKGDVPPMGQRIDLISAEINDFISLLSDEHTSLHEVADSGRIIFGVRAPFFHAQGILTGVCLELKAARDDFKQVLELQSALVPFDQSVKSACATLGIKPLPVFNGSGYGFLGGNVKTLAEHIGTVLYDLNAVQQALAGGAATTPRRPR